MHEDFRLFTAFINWSQIILYQGVKGWLHHQVCDFPKFEKLI